MLNKNHLLLKMNKIIIINNFDLNLIQILYNIILYYIIFFFDVKLK